MYIIWNKKKDKLNFPTVIHEVEDDAIEEAERLADKYPGDEFIVLPLDKGKVIKTEQPPLTRLGIIKKLKRLKRLCTENDTSILDIMNHIDKIIERSKTKKSKSVVISGGIPLGDLIHGRRTVIEDVCPVCGVSGLQFVDCVDGRITCSNCKHVRERRQ